LDLNVNQGGYNLAKKAKNIGEAQDFL